MVVVVVVVVSKLLVQIDLFTQIENKFSFVFVYVFVFCFLRKGNLTSFETISQKAECLTLHFRSAPIFAPIRYASL